uniref:dolichol kinase n=1 Tax=Spongospora subterranea TaxID=70186 RepID=A0A0H5RLD1_9EUKA|eukprot:CRZ09534.1 hypothetical protein [Spongospora subterranea]
MDTNHRSASMAWIESICILYLCSNSSQSPLVSPLLISLALSSILAQYFYIPKKTLPFPRLGSGPGLVIGLTTLPILTACQLHIGLEHSPLLFHLSIVNAVLSLVQYAFPHDDRSVSSLLGAIFSLAIGGHIGDIIRVTIVLRFQLYYMHILAHRLPHCFTFGEAHIISTLISFFVCNGLFHLFSTVFFFLPFFVKVHPIIALNDSLLTIAQYAILATAMIVWAEAHLLSDRVVGAKNVEDLDERVSSEFLARIVLIVLFVHFCVMIMVDHEPISFMLLYLIRSPVRIMLCVFWAMCLMLSLVSFKRLEASCQLRTIVARKLYHLLISAIVIPGVVIDPIFTALALLAMLMIFTIFEVVRVSKMFTISHVLESYMREYIDCKSEAILVGRDSGSVILSHIYLLLGCSFPLFMHLPSISTPLFVLLSLAGVIALGIADAVASIIGVCFGSVYWPGSNKTLQGSLAAFVATSIASYAFIGDQPVLFRQLLCPAIISTLLEASMDQIDNLFLPLLYYASLVVAVR